MPVAVASGLLAGLFITFGRLVRSRHSGVALGFSLLLIIAGSLVLAFAARHQPGLFFGLFLYASSIIPILRGFKAVGAIQASEAAREMLRTQLDQRRNADNESPAE